MRRRELLLLACTAVICPPMAAAQTKHVATVGVLFGSAENAEFRRLLAAFRQALKDLGWTEGDNIRLDVRWSGGESGNNAAQARELVRSEPDVIFAAPSNVVIALQKQTRTIPVVFAYVSDPVAQGVVDNLARPTGNLTGFSNLEPSLMGKWVQILTEIAPGLRRVALMISIVNAASPIWYRMFKEEAAKVGIQPIYIPVKTRSEVGGAIESMAGEPHSALVVPGDTVLSDPAVRKVITNLAAEHRLPAVYGEVSFAYDRGLIAYGIDRIEPFRLAASYVNRILKGEKPANLPVQQPTKFQFVVNLKTARTIGVPVPPTLLARADEVIE